MSTVVTSVLAFNPFGMEMVLLVLGLLIFGRRLPEVGKSLGQGIKEFKKGMKDDDDHYHEPRREEPRRASLPQDQATGQTMHSAEPTKTAAPVEHSQQR